MLSIIVTVYNTEKYIKRCITSLLNQSINSYEIILVDDGSPDRCAIICDEYSKLDSRIKVIHKKNQGLGMARNSGLEIAKGDYVAFVDSDDYVESNYFKELLELAQKYDVDVCVSGKIYIDNGKRIKTRDCVSAELQNRYIRDKNVIKTFTAKVVSPNQKGTDYCSLSACFSLFRRLLFTVNNLSFVSERQFLSEDMEFNMNLYQVCESIYLSDICGYHYWYNENSLSRSNKKNRFSLLEKTTSAIEIKLNKYNIIGEDYRIAAYFWVNFEKCINQEIRYQNKGDYDKAEQNIKSMLSSPVTQKYLKIVYNNPCLPKEQSILCILLMGKHIKILILLLRIYNLIRH